MWSLDISQPYEPHWTVYKDSFTILQIGEMHDLFQIELAVP
jgi:hypothetical protein